MTDKQQRLVAAVAQQCIFFGRGQWRLGHAFGQCVGLEDYVAVGLWVIFPELGAEELTRQPVAAGQGQAMRQAHVSAAQQAVEHVAGKAAGHCRRLYKMPVDAAGAMQAAQRVDQGCVPAGVHHPETSGINIQRQLIEPVDELVPFIRIRLELRQCFADQTGMARGVLAHKQVTALGQRRCHPAQRIELMVAHDAVRLPGLNHVAHDVQRFANTWPSVDDVAEENRDALRVAPHASPQTVAQQFQQVLKDMGAPVHVTDQIIATRRIEH